MDASTRIAVSIAGSVVVALVTVIGYREYARARDIREAQDSLQQFTQTIQATAAESSRASAQAVAYRAAQQDAIRREDVRRRELLPGQRCIGGTVVVVNGSAYTQLLGWGNRPVPCTDGMAGQPIRS